MNLLILDASSKKNHTEFVLLCLAYFTYHVFQVHPKLQLSEFPSYLTVFHCMYITHTFKYEILNYRYCSFFSSSLSFTPNLIFLPQNIELIYHYLNVFSSWVWMGVQIARVQNPHYLNLPHSWVLDNTRSSEPKECLLLFSCYVWLFLQTHGL